MKIKLLSILAGVGMAMSNVQPALAQAQTEPIKFALCYDLSKVYAFAVPQSCPGRAPTMRRYSTRKAASKAIRSRFWFKTMATNRSGASSAMKR